MKYIRSLFILVFVYSNVSLNILFTCSKIEGIRPFPSLWVHACAQQLTGIFKATIHVLLDYTLDLVNVAFCPPEVHDVKAKLFVYNTYTTKREESSTIDEGDRSGFHPEKNVWGGSSGKFLKFRGRSVAYNVPG